MDPTDPDPQHRLIISVADPGCLSRIPDPDFLPIPDPGSRIPDPGSKNSNKRERWKKISCHTFLCSHKFHKIVNYFSFEVLKKKIWANFQRMIELFTKKIVKKLLKIWSCDPGCGKNLFRIPDPGVKKHPIPDPGSGSATLLIMVISRFQITWWELAAARSCRACVESWPSAGIPSPKAGSPSSGTGTGPSNDDIQNHHIQVFFLCWLKRE